MSLNRQSQAVETKLYFIVFFLFASFLALIVYNTSLDTFALEDAAYAGSIGIFRPHTAEKIDSFEECAAAGFPIGQSYPGQCFANGRAFIEKISGE